MTIPVKIHRVTVYSKMIVIVADSTYNVILEIPWLHNMKTVHSSYHQMIKFHIRRKVEKIMSDQTYSHSCFVSAMKGKTYEDK